jgi:hypothetical protein
VKKIDSIPTILIPQIQPRSKKTENATELHLSDPTLTEKTTQLINYTLRDFVSIWWGPMNFYGNKEFEDEIRVTINATVEALERSIQAHDSNDLLLAMLYGVANSLIIHMVSHNQTQQMLVYRQISISFCAR